MFAPIASAEIQMALIVLEIERFRQTIVCSLFTHIDLSPGSCTAINFEFSASLVPKKLHRVEKKRLAIRNESPAVLALTGHWELMY